MYSFGIRNIQQKSFKRIIPPSAQVSVLRIPCLCGNKSEPPSQVFDHKSFFSFILKFVTEIMKLLNRIIIYKKNSRYDCTYSYTHLNLKMDLGVRKGCYYSHFTFWKRKKKRDQVFLWRLVCLWEADPGPDLSGLIITLSSIFKKCVF